MDLRPERAADHRAVHAVHTAAFPTDAEACLVDRLRANDRATVSLVADVDGEIVGHVLFSPVVIDGSQRRQGLGLAPLAVLPTWQRRGIGSLLVAAGIDECRRRKVRFVAVLGHPTYYPRFGFVRADRLGFRNEYGATDAFFVLALREDALPAEGGLVRYGPEFGAFGPAGDS